MNANIVPPKNIKLNSTFEIIIAVGVLPICPSIVNVWEIRKKNPSTTEDMRCDGAIHTQTNLGRLMTAAV
jgi:hypothetical protein